MCNILGMINAGIGARQVTSLLSTLNINMIKPPHHTTLKEREREVGKALEEVAGTSVDEALLVKALRGNALSAKEACEGTTYQTDVGLSEYADNVSLPKPVIQPEQVPLTPHDGYTDVFFDLETTGLSKCDKCYTRAL